MRSIILMVIVLSLGSALSQEYMSLVPLLAVIYGVSFFVQRSFDYGADFFISFNARKDLRPTAKILLAGQEIMNDNQADSQEDRFLNFFDTSRVVKRRLVGIIIPISGYFFLHRNQILSPSFNTIIPLISCYFIVNAFYFGHFYVILGLNLLLAVINIDSDTSGLVLVAYVLLFMLNIGLMSQKGEMLKKNLPQLLVMGAVYLLMSWGVYQFIKKPDFHQEQTPEVAQLSQQQQAQLQHFIGQQQELSFKVEDVLSKLENIPQLSADSSNFEQQLSLRNIKLGRLKNLAAKPQLSEKQREQAGELIKSLEDNQAQIEAALNELSSKSQGMKTLTDEEYEKLSSVLSEQGDRELTAGEKASVTEYLAKKSNGIPPALSEKLNGVFKAQEAKKFLEASLTQDQKTTQKLIKEALKSAQTPPAQMGAIEPEKKITPENKPKDWMRRLRPLLVLVGLFFLLRFILKKKGVKKVSSADPVLMEELSEKWKQIRKRKFSPREEVIHYYHLFHESIQKIHYPKAETPPSCIVAINMEDFNPELTKATMIVTEIFAQCFYGHKDVNTEALKLFRRGLKRILTVYQLD